jgi:cathepsin B
MFDFQLSCCSSCGFGCNGGDPMAAWRYWVSDGIVTGSNYTEKHGCRPYPFPVQSLLFVYKTFLFSAM